MPKKKDLLDKLCRKPMPRNFTKQELKGYRGDKLVRVLLQE